MGNKREGLGPTLLRDRNTAEPPAGVLQCHAARWRAGAGMRKDASMGQGHARCRSGKGLTKGLTDDTRKVVVTHITKGGIHRHHERW